MEYKADQELVQPFLSLEGPLWLALGTGSAARVPFPVRTLKPGPVW